MDTNTTSQTITPAKLEEAFQRLEQAIAALNRRALQEYLSTKQAARYLGVSYQYLEVQRCHGGGPPYLTLGKRAVRYLKSDLDMWATSQRKTHTSQQSMPRVCSVARMGDNN